MANLCPRLVGSLAMNAHHLCLLVCSENAAANVEYSNGEQIAEQTVTVHFCIFYPRFFSRNEFPYQIEQQGVLSRPSGSVRLQASL